MRPRRRASLGLGVALVGLAGCAATTTRYPGDGGDARAGDASGFADGHDAFDEVIYRDVPVVFETFQEDRCPDAGPRMRQYDCDPFDPVRSCPNAGEACYPFIQYPDVPCGAEVYRAQCITAGTLRQNDFCGGSGGDYCGPGLTCFVTGSGNRCLRLCSLTGGSAGCPRGQVCEPTDSPDIGACD